MNNIILCGFMGCGKTTVGRRLSRRLGLEYLDLDEEIARESGMSIPDIFAQWGEARFRELEHAAVAGLGRRIGCVVSTGGGALTYPRNVAAIDRARDLVVFLDAPFQVCYDRIRDSDRPLVRQSSPDELRRLFDERREKYLAAADRVVPAGGDAGDVCDAILAAR